MLREITLGQYYPVDSVLHRMDPRTKLMGTLLFIISLFCADSFFGYGVSVLFLAAVIRLSKVPFKFMVRGLKAILVLLLISVSFNLFLTDGEVLVRLGFLKITLEGVRTAAFMALRLIFLVLGSSVMTLTTTPNELTDGLEKGLGFLNKVGVILKMCRTDIITFSFCNIVGTFLLLCIGSTYCIKMRVDGEGSGR